MKGRSFFFHALSFAFLLITIQYPASAAGVLSVSPAQNAIGVPAGTTIEVTFDTVMNTASFIDTMTFIVSGLTSGRHTGAFGFSSGDSVVTFTPDVAFPAGEVVVVDVTGGIETAGNVPITPFVYTITVELGSGPGFYAAPEIHQFSAKLSSVAVCDLDGDGDADLAVTSPSLETVSIMLNNGDGTFAAAVDYPTSEGTYISVSDLDGDGDQDLAVEAGGGVMGHISILKNNGDGTFAPKIDYPVGFAPREFSLGDLDGDGDVDLAVPVESGDSLCVCPSNRGVSILLNNGDGTFAGKIFYSDSLYILRDLVLGDMDGDGDVDLVTSGDDSIAIMKNNGDGVFAPGVKYQMGVNLWPSLALGDIDGDGDLDVVMGGLDVYPLGAIYVMKNNGDGTLAGNAVFPMGYAGTNGSASIYMSDVDGDGDVDIAATNEGGTVAVLSNNGDGTFIHSAVIDAGRRPRSVIISDLDGNGRGDFVMLIDQPIPSVNDVVSIVKFIPGERNGVVSVLPEQNATGVASTAPIEVSFSGPINTASINDTLSFIVTGQSSGRHRGSFSFSGGDAVVSFTSDSAFFPGEIVKVDVTGLIKDVGDLPIVPFMCTFTTAVDSSPGDFGPPVGYNLSVTHQAVVYDVDGDGDGDVVATAGSGITGRVAVFKNNGNGTLSSPVEYPKYLPVGVSVGDIDGDGDGDIVVQGGGGGDTLSILKNDGDGTFPVKNNATENLKSRFGVSDLDGDGDADLVSVGAWVLKNNGDGSKFLKYSFYVSSTSGYYVGDIDGDGDDDLVNSAHGPDRVSVLKNNGQGMFLPPENYTVGNLPGAVFMSDLDGDGDIDIAVVNRGSNDISILKNYGDGTFGARVDYPTGKEPISIFGGDVDGDGDIDLAVANNYIGSNSISVLKNVGDGTFMDKVDYPAGTEPETVIITDMDRDGDADIVISNLHGIRILMGLDQVRVIVQTVSPTTNAADIKRDSVIEVTFSGPMKTSSFNDTSSFIVTGLTTGRHRGSFGFSGGNTHVTFTPDSVFSAGEIVLVEVTNRLVDPLDIPIHPYNFSFTTAFDTGEGTFADKVDYSTGVNPRSVYVSDLDGDGDGDLVVTNRTDNSVSVLKNDGKGVFGGKVDYQTGSLPHSVFATDLDGDGDGDLAVANSGSNSVSILKNSGDGTFTTKVDYSVGTLPTAISLADMDGDGDADIVVANSGSSGISVRKNNGNGTFSTNVAETTGIDPQSLVVSDLDGDGDKDVAVANAGSNTVSVLRNYGDGSFALRVDYSTGLSPRAVRSADLDGDGDGDLVVANAGSSTVSIFKNNGDGTFVPGVEYAAGSTPYSVAIGDIDGDGDGDIAVSDSSSNNIAILLNNGNGTFAAPGAYPIIIGDATFTTSVAYPTGTSPLSVFLSDVNGDGVGDLVTANANSNNVSVLLGNAVKEFTFFSLQPKWNIVSLPRLMDDSSVATLFPGANTSAYAYSGGGYAATTTMEYGRGYWLKFPAGDSIGHFGLERTEETVDVEQGWNLIGSLTSSIPLTNIGSIPGGIVTSKFYRYDGSYVSSSTLEPGIGYWVKASQAGQLTMNSTEAIPAINRIRILDTGEIPPPPPSGGTTSAVPDAYALHQNYPNPFNPLTTINYATPAAGHVKLTIHNVLGQEVAVLVDEVHEAGYRTVSFDASYLASGMYTYRLTAGSFIEVKKMMLLR